MKKLLIAIVVLLAACTPEITNFQECLDAGNPAMESYPRQCATADGKHFVEEIARPIKDVAREAITNISNKNFAALPIHDERDLLFGPHIFVNPANHQIWTQGQLETFFENDKEHYWGEQDGSGKNIELTPPEYYDKFIYDKDFANAEIVNMGYPENSIAIKTRGNMLDNNFDIFPNTTIVQYHINGTNPEFEGMDWASLRLVFEKDLEKWYLVAIIHDQWTI